MASVTYSAPVYTFTCDAGNEARARFAFTCDAADDRITLAFRIDRRALAVSIGITAGGNDIADALYFDCGDHRLSFNPGATTFYVDFVLGAVGIATLELSVAAPGVLTLPAPWAEADLRSLRCAQSIDVMYIVAAGYQPRVLERRGTDSWSLRKYQPLNGPFEPTNRSDITLAVSARTGEATLTASGPLFRTYDAGALVRLTHTGSYETADLSAAGQYTEAIKVTGIEDGRKFNWSITGTFVGTLVLERSVGVEGSWTTVTSHDAPGSGQYDDGFDNQIIYYRFRLTAHTSGTATASLTYAGGITDGIVRIVSVDADNSCTVDIIETPASTTATVEWCWGSWSGRSGWPSAVELYDGRLYMLRGDKYWGSEADDYEGFFVGPDAADAIGRFSSAAGAIGRWLKEAGSLYIGMSNAEGTISSNVLGDVIKPENVRSLLPTQRGSINADALSSDNGAIFISASARRVYRMEQTSDGLIMQELTRLHQEICGASGFVEVFAQQEPEPRMWAIRGDGVAAICLFDRGEQVTGWQRLVLGGAIESGATRPGEREDAVYMVVRRTIDGETVRYIEKLAAEQWDAVEDAWRLDCALRYEGVAATTITNLDHLEGEAVYAWTSVGQQGPFTVSGGAITLTAPVTSAIIGKLMHGYYKGPCLNWGASAGTALTQDKKVTRLGARIHRSVGGAVSWGRDFTTMDTLPERRVGDSYDSPLTPISGDFNLPFNGATDKDARVHIKFGTAGPGEVLLLVPHVETKER